MDPNTTFDHRTDGLPPSESPSREWPGLKKPAETSDLRFPAEDGGKSLAAMAERDLDATLQLLAERAQYITGATGAAIAVMDHNEMVCKASAGVSTPEIGARLQMDSGLSGESIRTKETLRCDDTKTDGRVNQESCEELGIASVVVMPILEGEDVIGVFELFSNHPHAFQDRDITALERMGFMVRTALAQAESAQMGAKSEDRLEKRELDASAARGEGFGIEDEEDEISAPPAQSAASLEESDLIAKIRRFAREKGITIAPKSETNDEQPRIERPKIAFHIPGSTSKKIESSASTKAAHEVASPTPSVEGPKREWAEPKLEQVPRTTLSKPEEENSPTLSAPAPGTHREEAQKSNAGAQEPGTRPSVEEMIGAATAGEEKKSGAVLRSVVAQPEVTTPGLDATGLADQGKIDVGEQVKASLDSEDAQKIATPDKEPTLKSLVESATSIMEPSKGGAAPTARSVEKARTAVAGLRRCEVCGFPVSEGRKFCLDCERKKPAESVAAIATEVVHPVEAPQLPAESGPTEQPSAPAEKSVPQVAETVPAAPQFLMNSSDQDESWIASHKYAVVAIAIVIVGLIVYLLSR